ncbi:MAG: sensor histidine kinase [Cytophagales bacterium]
MKAKLIISFLLLFFGALRGQITVNLDHGQHFDLTQKNAIFYIDSANTSFDSLIWNPQNYTFYKNNNDLLIYDQEEKWYWLRYEIKSDGPNNSNWILECYNPTIDSIYAYWFYENGLYVQQFISTQQNFYDQKIQHKNLVFQMPKDFNRGLLFIKLKNKVHANIQIKLKKTEFFLNYALREYLILGIFYGCLAIAVLFNIVLFLNFRNWAHFIYIVYVLSVGFYSSTLDGIGFQYLWPSKPDWNDFIYQISHFWVLTVFSIYFVVFLQVYQRYKPIFYFLIVWYLSRAVIFTLPKINDVVVNEFLFFDNIPYFLAFGTSILSFLNGYKPARYFILAFSFLTLSFVIHSLRVADFLPPNVLTTYALNFGLVFEIFFLSLALSDYLTRIALKSFKALKETKELKEKIEIQSKTLSLQGEFLKEKTKDFETLLYRISHDIQGPVKRIKGLINLALTDEQNSSEYVNKVEPNIKTLENILKDLVTISNLNRKTKLDIKPLNLLTEIESIIESERKLLDNQNINIRINTQTEIEFFTDPNYLDPVFCNLFNNAIKFQKSDNPEKRIDLKIVVNEEKMEFEISDNGIGISKEELKNIFDIFYKKGETLGHGLGLFIVKLSVEKLNGTIEIESETGKGTKVKVSIPNMKPKNQG